MIRNPQGLWKPTPDVIARARADTSAQINRILLTFVGTTIFCLLSLLTPDSALLAGSEKLSVPFTGPVSFFGFMLLGPAVLIVLRVYLQIYVEHELRLDRVARRLPTVRTLTLAPAKNPLLQIFSGFVLFLLLPLAMLSFFWKAAVFAYWGTGLLSVAAAIVAMHLTLPVRSLSWRLRAILSLSAAILVGGVTMTLGPLTRPFNLPRANLSDQWLNDIDLRNADLRYANLANTSLFNANLSGAKLLSARLTGANLTGVNLSDTLLNYADLSRADFSEARLTGANLTGANISGAFLGDANLADAVLTRATLTDADLSAADLSGAELFNANLSGAKLRGSKLSGTRLDRSKGLTQQQIDRACGDAKTLLPPGLKLVNVCSRD